MAMKKCPFCAEDIQADATKCRYCGEWLTSQETVAVKTTYSRPQSISPQVARNPVSNVTKAPEVHPLENLLEDSLEQRDIAEKRPQNPSCPHCGFSVTAGTTICGHCGKHFMPLSSPVRSLAPKGSAIANTKANTNASASANTSGMGKDVDLPPEIAKAGFNVGAFMFSWVWCLANKMPLSVTIIAIILNPIPTPLGFIPIIAFFECCSLGSHGNTWAWQNRRWDSIEQFKKVQRIWSYWGLAYLLFMFVLAWQVSARDRAILRGDTEVVSLGKDTSSVRPESNTSQGSDDINASNSAPKAEPDINPSGSDLTAPSNNETDNEIEPPPSESTAKPSRALWNIPALIGMDYEGVKKIMGSPTGYLPADPDPFASAPPYWSENGVNASSNLLVCVIEPSSGAVKEFLLTPEEPTSDAASLLEMGNLDSDDSRYDVKLIPNEDNPKEWDMVVVTPRL